MQTLPAIAEPVYFVFKDSSVTDQILADGETPPPVEEIWHMFGHNPAPNWVIQTYIQLKRRGLDVHLVNRFVPGRICVVSMWHLSPKDLTALSYCVVVRADCCRPGVADHVIVQNPLNVESPTDHLIQHWPQPGLKPRDVSRGDRVENLVFYGKFQTLWAPLRTTPFRHQLEALGVRLDAAEAPGRGEPDARDWTDYEDADVIIAMRNLTQYDAKIKPATKLTNAWLAGCPALMGPEPAYQALRHDDLDYIEVRSVEDILRAVKRLKSDPNLYRQMVNRAHERAGEFDADAISRSWRNTLGGPVTEGFYRWQARQSVFSKPLALMKQPGRVLKHRHAIKKYLRDRSLGPRILSES